MHVCVQTEMRIIQRNISGIEYHNDEMLLFPLPLGKMIIVYASRFDMYNP